MTARMTRDEHPWRVDIDWPDQRYNDVAEWVDKIIMEMHEEYPEGDIIVVQSGHGIIEFGFRHESDALVALLKYS